MNTRSICPCCSELLLRHARQGRIYWFCPHCHQEMPNLASAIAEHKIAQGSTTEQHQAEVLNLT